MRAFYVLTRLLEVVRSFSPNFVPLPTLYGHQQRVKEHLGIKALDATAQADLLEILRVQAAAAPHVDELVAAGTRTSIPGAFHRGSRGSAGGTGRASQGNRKQISGLLSPLKIIDCLRFAVELPFDEGLAKERGSRWKGRIVVQALRRRTWPSSAAGSC
ncbi:hypothetical protein [Cupriavidus necator]